MRRTDDADHTESIVAQGRALVWAIEALDEIESSCPFERELAELFQAACKRCLRAIVAEAPPQVHEEIQNVGEYIQDGRPVEWLDKRGEQVTLPPYPLITEAGGGDGDRDRDGAVGGDDKALPGSGLWTYVARPHHTGDQRYQSQILTEGEGKGKTRTVPI